MVDGVAGAGEELLPEGVGFSVMRARVTSDSQVERFWEAILERSSSL
jgi:hypothetical protein